MKLAITITLDGKNIKFIGDNFRKRRETRSSFVNKIITHLRKNPKMLEVIFNDKKD